MIMAETTILTDPHHVKADARMVAMAIKRGWKIPDSILDSLPSVLVKLVVTSDDDRTRLGAAKVLVAMKAQNDKTAPQPTRNVRHVHTVEPITESNFAERKRLLIERANRSGAR